MRWIALVVLATLYVIGIAVGLLVSSRVGAAMRGAVLVVAVALIFIGPS